MLPEVWINFA